MGTPTSQNKVNDRLNYNADANRDGVISEEEARSFRDQANPTDTAKNNYTGIRYGNDHGSCSFGHIHKPGDVTAGVMLQAKDGRHGFFMDNDGQRKGWSTLGTGEKRKWGTELWEDKGNAKPERYDDKVSRWEGDKQIHGRHRATIRGRKSKDKPEHRLDRD